MMRKPAEAARMEPERPDSGGILYAVCRLEDVPNRRPKAFQLVQKSEGGNPRVFSLFIARWGRQVFAYVNQCPHHGARLDWEPGQFLASDGRSLVCGKHGARFEIGTGRCLDGPCRGQGLKPIAVIIDDGDICLAGVELEEVAQA